VDLDVVSARKIGAPWNQDLALGAITSDGTLWLNDSLIENRWVEAEYIDDRTGGEREAARKTVERHRGDRPPLDLRGKTALVVDDGIATGATTIACTRQVEDAGADRVVVAVPVAPPETVERLRSEADDVVCIETVPDLDGIGRFYDSVS
jgi:predicted phosphoribosyltransferase